MSVRGADAAGDNVARAIGEAKIRDLSAVFLDRATPSYTALIDRDGDVFAGLADMVLYELAFAKTAEPREGARRGGRLPMRSSSDANLPADALARVAALAGAKPLFAIAISPAKAVRLSGILDRIACLFMNRREAAALSATPAEDAGAHDIARRLREAGLARGVITLGSEAVTGVRHGRHLHDRAADARRVADATGAGDALAGVDGRGDDARRAVAAGFARRHRGRGADHRQPDRPSRAISDRALAGAVALVPRAAGGGMRLRKQRN